jgi:hypothetical protein
VQIAIGMTLGKDRPATDMTIDADRFAHFVVDENDFSDSER